MIVLSQRRKHCNHKIPMPKIHDELAIGILSHRKYSHVMLFQDVPMLSYT